MVNFLVLQLRPTGETLSKSRYTTRSRDQKKALRCTGMVFFRREHHGMMAFLQSDNVLLHLDNPSRIRSRHLCTERHGIILITLLNTPVSQLSAHILSGKVLT